VACEGVPALFGFDVGTDTMTGKSIPLKGNPLDVAFVQTSPSSWTTIVSIDNVHKAGSTSELRDNTVSTLLILDAPDTNELAQDASRLQYFSKQANGQFKEDANIGKLLKSFALAGSDSPGLASADDKAVRDILYHVENLRKRPGAED
jgi:tRNA (guanine-N(7)-)-methyltransferase subunit TRM82